MRFHRKKDGWLEVRDNGTVDYVLWWTVLRAVLRADFITTEQRIPKEPEGARE